MNERSKILEPQVTVELASKSGLTKEEYDQIVKILGRLPSYTELGMFSVMWSEHCSYKNSIVELKKLPRKGGRLLVEAGEENAGLVDIGEGYAVAFKIESHNHPSAVEPYQGAATGVGGIMRDIFTMGARPIASLNSLRFGKIDLPRTKFLLKGVVKGIGDYGNSFGVPTVAGDVYFDECYDDNPLVNAMSVGIVRREHIARAIASGEGNLVVIVGSSTGRDGIHGATFASEEISEESDAKRPSVQVGDPFTEKLLLEATLEAIKLGLVVGVQDMGAAGITCSTAEMSARGKVGMEIELDNVHVREKNMSAYEIMLSESQERMLLVVLPENIKKLEEVFRKWDLDISVIGRVTGNGRVHIHHQGETVADVPAESMVLGGGAPVYVREKKVPSYIDLLRAKDLSGISEPGDYSSCILSMLSSPNMSSRNWITRQYDSMVRTDTITEIRGDAAVVRIKGTKKALAMKTDCNPRYVYLNPYRGAEIAVAESARNVVCVGAKPIAITNCLNFGNPYKPEVFWQFSEAIRGIGDACRALETPVTGGNVSFYNESPVRSVFPTPVIGMLGEVSDYSRCISAGFKKVGDAVIVLGKAIGHLGGSEYLNYMHGMIAGDAPDLDLDLEKGVQSACLEMIEHGWLNSAHDISDGGLAIALAECCILSHPHDLGIEFTAGNALRLDKFLFGEDQSRIVISCDTKDLDNVRQSAKTHNVELSEMGHVIPKEFKLLQAGVQLSVKEMREVYMESLRRRIEG
ncbi:MAG TPA: phosphoribosylformylglycinamidine synthase subunit PurL [Bacteroidota bacterium]|nr:phosphoribosylformylglycinamidine synthase subunit PurL [Bacteroidota bacterium]